MRLKAALLAMPMLVVAACKGGGDTALEEAAADYGQTRGAVISMIAEADAKGFSLSGQQVNEYEVFIDCTSFERIYELTGKWPAILGLELMFIIKNPAYREFFMARAEDHAARGGVVAITWHARNPLRVCPRGEFYLCSQMAMSEEQLSRILDPQTKEHALWAADVDAIADVLKELQAKGVAPIFRPYHEMNGGWFWWGQKDSYADLWRMLHDRLSGQHGLDNLVWMWSPDKESTDAGAYFPGEESVDLVGGDIYARDSASPMYETAKQNVQPLHSSGVFAFTEIGLLPSPEIFKAISPAYFLLWGGEFIDKGWAANDCGGCNTAEDVASIYALEEVVTLDELEWPQEANVRFDEDLRAKGPAVSCPARLLSDAYD